MAFITKSNARHLEYQTNRHSVEKILVEDLYKLSLWMLTKKEQQWLAAARMFYENPDFYIKHIYVKVERPKGPSNLVYVAGQPAYHARKECDVLSRDYLNYEIPPEIVGRGEPVVVQFREWWKSEQTLLNSDPKRFLEKMGIRWLLKNPPNLRSIEADNSGVEVVENRELSEVESEIDNLIEFMGSVRADRPELIDKYGKRTFMVKNGSIDIENADDRSTLVDWDKRKDTLKDRMRLYFQLRFNPDLEMKGTVLESVGFRPCAHCHGNR